MVLEQYDFGLRTPRRVIRRQRSLRNTAPPRNCIGRAGWPMPPAESSVAFWQFLFPQNRRENTLVITLGNKQTRSFLHNCLQQWRLEHSSEHDEFMDGEIARDQRCNSTGDLRGVLPVFPYPSGTGNPTCLRLSVGDSRIRPEHDRYHDLFPRTGRALNAQTLRQRAANARVSSALGACVSTAKRALVSK